MIMKDRYKDTILRMTHFMYPDAPLDAINRALDWSITNRYKEERAELYNNYTGERAQGEDAKRLIDLTEWILQQQPILTPYGVMFMRPGTEPVPLLNMIKSFMDLRGIHKDQMFQYDKGTDMFNHFNLLQLLDKIDANGTYGVA